MMATIRRYSDAELVDGLTRLYGHEFEVDDLSNYPAQVAFLERQRDHYTALYDTAETDGQCRHFAEKISEAHQRLQLWNIVAGEFQDTETR